ncbi:hypothetical protein pepv_193 [Penguinpox virus]|uniref:Uncharacterized protein n=1 Tax=Penguinpox virus TaxID=648998 RepID=A0A068EF63_9POXV|nr:hypothetical protein HM90_gp196 [Penguinpox virus]AID46919.1 hypothetical protein pepv_193 [Penguinpox virus]
MYIENNSLILIIPETNSIIPQLFTIHDNKPICVSSIYSLIPSKKENVQISYIDNIHMYFRSFKNLYLVNPRNHDIIKVFNFLKNYKWGGNFYLLFNV